MPLKKNIFEAMFDIRPVKNPGVLDFEKIQKVKNNIDLSKKYAKLVRINKVAKNKIIQPLTHGRILEEFEKAIFETVDAPAVLSSIGGRFYSSVANHRIKRRPIWRINKNKISQEAGEEKAIHPSDRLIKQFWNFEPSIETERPATDYVWPASQDLDEPVIAQDINFEVSEQEPVLTLKSENKIIIKERHDVIPSEVDYWIKRSNQEESQSEQIVSQNYIKIKPKKKIKITRKALLVAFIVIVSFLLVYEGLSLKNNILQNGDHALANLQQAKNDLTKFDFSSAAQSFSLAYDSFNQAASTLDTLGASFLSSFGSIPGVDKVKSANNMVLAGQHISKAGKNLAIAFDTLSKTNFVSFFQNSDQTPDKTNSQKQSLLTLLSDFKQVLVFSENNIKEASQLLADIDVASLPAEKQQLLMNFKEKIPAFQEYIGSAVDYSDFLLGVVGDKGIKRYIILLENNSELRATGGFPGTYAVVVFDHGYLKSISVDDVYNIDGQVKENIIPPIPLQHITPNWGMRDANWFADFPTSAIKVEEMYLKDGGEPMDGILAITPDIIGKILNIIGSIAMPEYGLTINADNFMSQIQKEVEYGSNRIQPKTIVKELQPKLFAALAGQDKDHWSQIFKAVIEESKGKRILAYFNDPILEATAKKNELAGDIKSTNGDYLQVVFSNVKGSKTDAVIKNSFDLRETTDTLGDVSHVLVINRLHNGGNSQFGFYNKINPSYIRVYAPKGATLESITGNTITNFKPLISYEDFGFKKDSDLVSMEENTSHPFSNVDVYEESGKTVFGFWLVTKPQESKSVTVTYRTPNVLTEKGYELLWQKQAGTGEDQINYSFEIPKGKEVTGISENLQAAGSKVFMSSDLSVDRQLSIELK